MTIQTFVFFDVETTGIPANAAKVTEISLISVSRTDIEQADGVNLPAMSKLSLLCNPKKNIQPTAIKLTGLTNQFLQNQPDFKDHINCINAFLDKPKPVCLVAHNGKLYDFKILQAEYQTANEKLPHDLLCVDSLSAFRTILKTPKNAMHDNSECSLDESDRVIKTEDWQDLSTEEIQEIDELVDQFSQLTSEQKGIKVENESKIGTPKQFSQPTSTPKRIKVENETKIGPSKQCTQPTSTPKGIKVENESKSETPKQEKAPRVSYALSSVYKKLLNKKPKECHRAEADCIMLLECVIATKHDFLVYADSKQKFISQI